MNAVYNKHSKRAQETKFLVFFSDNKRNVLFIVAMLLLFFGIALWFYNSLFGSLITSLSILMYLPLVWHKLYLSTLSHLPITGDTIIVEDNLSPYVAGRVNDIDSPFSIWSAIKGCWQQRFFSLHYGIEPELFDSLTKDKTDLTAMWDSAFGLSQKHQETGISTASLIISLMKMLPGYEQILADRNLDINELESSIDWVHHAELIIDYKPRNKGAGGIARDWTSGFTPTLNEIAHNISLELEQRGHLTRGLEGHRATLDEITSALKGGKQNVILVGDVGVGKTITVYGFASRLMLDKSLPDSIRYHQVFAIDPTSLITSSDDPNKVEAIFTRLILEAQKSKNAILFFDDASKFFSTGTGQVNIGKMLQSVIESNSIPVIFAMTPVEWQNVSASNEALAGALNVVKIQAAENQHTLRILEDQSLYIEGRNKVVISYQALKSAVDLSDRYIREISAPGNAIRLLENSINHAENGLVTTKSVQSSIEAAQGVKIQTASGSEKQELLNLEDEIHKRMINQYRAVKVVADALRRARSGVNNPDKPIGTFLFLGPTGVGKTELSKAISATYFGDEKNLVRVDMNELTNSTDVARLIDETAENGLLASVGRNPFSVVLFDEIEKAHPNVINSILQMLDEGEMRDSKNRQISFKDAIVIATSNAGADKIREYIDDGKEVEQFEEEFTNCLIDSGIFKPEFLNRFDEMVVFRPLKMEELVQVVDILMAAVNSNLSKQKVKVELTNSAKQWLANQGYDQRLGARPLRRKVQSTVENIIAKKILSPDFRPGATISLDVPDLEAEG